MDDRTNVRGGDVNPDQMPRWIGDRKQYHARRRRESDAKRRVVPGAGAVENLVRLEAQNRLTPAMQAGIIVLAARYARANKLDFDGSVAGAIRLAAHAERVVRDAVELAARVGED